MAAWVNKTTLRTLSYAEGDVTYIQCTGAESFDTEIATMCRFYEPGAAFNTIGADGVTRYYQARREFFIDRRIAATAAKSDAKINRPT